jgi:hypothetical protein
MKQLVTIIKSHRVVVAILAIGLSFTACQVLEFPDLPTDAEIIFTTENEDVWEIGSVKSDGTSIEYFLLPDRIGHLIWPNDNTILGIAPSPGNISASVQRINGRIAFGEQGDSFTINYCEGVLGYEAMNFIDNDNSPTAFVVNAARELSIIDLHSCEVTNTYLEIDQYPDEFLRGAAISPDESWVAYSIASLENRFGTIFILDLETQYVMELTRGRNPAISPNGEWISLVQDDGIYIIRPDGTDVHHLVDMEIRIPGVHEYIMGVPYPRWSPDGEFLIYHDPPRGQFRYYPEDANICIVNIISNEVITLVEGGIYPFWKGGR